MQMHFLSDQQAFTDSSGSAKNNRTIFICTFSFSADESKA